MNQQNLDPHKWQPGQTGNPNGRPRKIYTILKETGYGGDDVKTAFQEMAFYSMPELKRLYDDESKPAIIRIVANQLYKALTLGDWSKIKEIIEHTIGKPVQPMAHKIQDGKGFYDLYEEAQNHLKQKENDRMESEQLGNEGTGT